MAVGDGVGVGVGAATISGDGLDAGELTTAELAAAAPTGAELAWTELAALDVAVLGEPTSDVRPADEG